MPFNLDLMKKNALLISILCIVFVVFFGSCTPAKHVIYFENLQKDTILHNLADNNFEQKISKNDILSINIISPDPVTTPLFNGVSSSGTSSGSSSSTSTSGGYLVDNDGNIALYKLGVIHVEGLTRNQLKQKLQKDLTPYLKDAVVNIRFLNNRITILGEVSRPQVITIPNERISILEAIGQSGDLTFTGRRDNILVIRETENGKQFKRINLNDKSIFYSPFFYLKADDVVYVEPTKSRINNTLQNQQIIGYILSGITIAITLLANIKK